MNDNETLGVIVKVMHLLRTGKINSTTKNIDVLRMIKQ